MRLKLLKKRFKDQALGTNAFELDGVKLYLKKSEVSEPRITADETLKWIRSFWQNASPCFFISLPILSYVYCTIHNSISDQRMVKKRSISLSVLAVLLSQ